MKMIDIGNNVIINEKEIVAITCKENIVSIFFKSNDRIQITCSSKENALDSIEHLKYILKIK